MISIVIPIFNREEVISRAVDSVIYQTYEDWELLIVDDGSTDNTKELIREKYSNEPRIELLERPEDRPKGANACRNIGIEKAQGKYIALLDSDDEWKEKHLEECYCFAEQNNNFAGSYTSVLVQRGPVKIKRKARPISEDESYLDFLLSGGSAMTPTYFLKAGLAREAKFDETLQRHQDWDFFIRFGQEFSWEFNPSMNVVVHRELKNTYANIDFNSCIDFYENYKDHISKKDLKIRYLSRMYDKAVFTNNTKGQKYYRKKLIELSQFENHSNSKGFFKKTLLKLQEYYLFSFCKYFAKKIIRDIKY